MKTNLRLCIIATLLFGLITSARAQQGFFNEVSTAGTRQRMPGQVIRFKTYTINIDGLQSYLSHAPSIRKERNTQGLLLEIPLPNGQSAMFRLYESSVMSPEIAERYQSIRTYSGRGVQDPSSKIKITISPEGFNAIVLDVHGDAVLFEKIPGEGSRQNLYRSYHSRDIVSKEGRSCESLIGRKIPYDSRAIKREDPKLGAKFSNGSDFKKFRIAIAATGEYTAALGGGSPTAAYATIVAYINEVNAVYETELGVTFELVSDETLVYADAATDPYTATDQSAMLDENQSNMDMAIGDANYDIGHVLGWAGSSSGGGLASSPSVCESGSKGQGASDVGDELYYTRVFTIQLIAHEIGHQFGMSHSYNSNIPVCTTRELSTSVEPGSGATIMSYGFTCDSDDYSNEYDGDGKKTGPFLNFHAVSINQALDYIATLSCYSTIATGNTIPLIAGMGTSYTIPRSTPFALSGTATDADGDPLSYSWEGTNISTIGDSLDADGYPVPLSALTADILASDTSAPFFRSYQPVATGTRTYPLLSAILNGSNYAPGDKLPSIEIVTTHTLTTRDNFGGIATEDVSVTIDESGPFLIENDPSGIYGEGDALVVEWSVNGTDLSPVSCTLVDILLSADGGLTFPTVLAAAVPNTGSYTVVTPAISTSQARIKVMPSTSTASGNVPNIFFDISNEDFTIGTPLPLTLLSFEASYNGNNNALLYWQTTQETNTAGFEIEKATGDLHFDKLGYVAGKGNGPADNHYTYPVVNLAAGKHFFRLKQLDKDGRFTYSPVRTVNIDEANKITLYPNPAGSFIAISGIQSGSRIVATDIYGRVYRDIKAATTPAYMDLAQWAAGVYFITITDPLTNRSQYKIIKTK